MVSLIFLGIDQISLSITFFWSQLNLGSVSQQPLAISFWSQWQFLTNLLRSSECDIHLEDLRPFARGSVSIWLNYLEDILTTHLLLFVILVALCVTLLLLINSLNFRICLFFVNSRDFLFEFPLIFSDKIEFLRCYRF